MKKIHRRKFVQLAACSALSLRLSGPVFAEQNFSSTTNSNISPKLLAIGDSILAAANDAISSADSEYVSHNTLGEIVWAWMRNPFFSYEVWATRNRTTNSFMQIDGSNQAVIGTTSRRLVDPDEVNHIRELNPDIVVVGFGANDIPLGISLEEIKYNYTTFLDKMIGEDGRVVIVALVRPHVTSGAYEEIYNYAPDGNKWRAHFDLNKWLRDQLPKLYGDRLSVWDTFTPLADPNSYLGSEFLPGMHRDGVHLTAQAAYANSKTFEDAIAPFLTPTSPYLDATAIDLIPTTSTPLQHGHGVTGEGPVGWYIARTIGEHSSAALTTDSLGVTTIDFSIKDEETVAFKIRFHPEKFISTENFLGKTVQLILPIVVEKFDGFEWIMASIYSGDKKYASESPRPYKKSSRDWPNDRFSGHIITPGLKIDEIKDLGVTLEIRMRKGTGVPRIKILEGVILREVGDLD